jgi:TM2 domain-containing membrane protein YozV
MPQKNRVLALFLAAFPLTGIFGIDRWYLGKPGTAIIKACTLGGLTLWWFFDFAVLSLDNFLWVFGKDDGFVKDGEGRELKYGFSAYRFKDGKIKNGWSD